MQAIKYQYAEAIKYQYAEATSYKMLHKVSTNTITVSDYLKVIMKLCHTRHTHITHKLIMQKLISTST